MSGLSASLDRKGLRFSPQFHHSRKLAHRGEGLTFVTGTSSSGLSASKAAVARIDWEWASGAIPFKCDNPWTRFGSEPIRLYRIIVEGLHESKSTASNKAPSECFRGRVDKIQGDIAFVTLISPSGETLAAQWPEEDLAKATIGKGDLFELTMTDMNGQITSNFRKLTRKSIPDDLWTEIEELRVAYADLLDDQGETGEESE